MDDLTPLFGRVHERSWLQERLDDTPRLLILHGAPGIGKTHLCAHLLGERPDTLWIDARPLQALGTPAAEALSQALDLPVLEGDGLLLEDLRTGPHRRIVWDNAEWLPGLEGALRPWLEAGARVTFLMLTRTRVEEGDDTLELQALLDPGAAQALFAHHAADPSGDTSDIVSLLEHHPLSLALAATQTRWLSAQELERRLKTSPPDVRIEALGANERVRDLIQSSWERLSPRAQALMLRATGFPWTMPLRDLWDLCPGSAGALEEIVESSLGRVTEQRSLELSSLIRAFCQPLRAQAAQVLEAWFHYVTWERGNLQGRRVRPERLEALLSNLPTHQDCQTPDSPRFPQDLNLRIVLRLLHERWAQDTLQAPTERAPTLTIGPQALWFRLDQGERVDLRRRGPMRQIIWTLAQRRLTHPGQSLSVYDLFEAAWDEPMRNPEQDVRRVYNNISRLRRMGLEEIVWKVEEGYHIPATVEVHVEGSR